MAATKEHAGERFLAWLVPSRLHLALPGRRRAEGRQDRGLRQCLDRGREGGVVRRSDAPSPHLPGHHHGLFVRQDDALG